MENGVQDQLQFERAEDRVETAGQAVNAAWDWVRTDQTDIKRPPASAMETAVTAVENACWRRLLKTIRQMVMALRRAPG